MKNIVPELQQYLLQRGEYSRADYLQLKIFGSDIAVNYIKYDNMEKAKEIFIKLVSVLSQFLSSSWQVHVIVF